MGESSADFVTKSRLLQDEFYVNDLRKKKGSVWNIVKNLIKITIFVCFVVFFMMMVLGEDQNRHRHFSSLMKNSFDTEAPRPLESVKSVETFWAYMNHTFLPIFLFAESGDEMGETFETIFEQTLMDGTKVDNFGTRLVGKRILMRTFRVKESAFCAGKVSENVFENPYDCFPSYSELTKDTEMYGKNGKAFQSSDIPGVADASNVTNPVFPTIDGQLNQYVGNGYLQTFGESVYESAGVLDMCVEQQYVDALTRAVTIEFNVWSANDGFIGVTRILFEISPTGKWVNSFKFDVITERYLEPKFDGMMTIELIMILFVFFYLAEELTELVITKTDYLRDGWNIVDWVNLALLVVWITLRISCYIASSEVLDNLEVSDRYTDLSLAVSYLAQCRYINAINTIFLSLKVIKYMVFLPYVTTLVWTLRNSWKYFVSFFVIFIAVVVGFALALFVGFGDKFKEIKDFQRAMIFIVRSFVGSINLNPLADAQHWLGGMLIIIMAMVLFFLVLNLFFGIMVAALAEAKVKMAVTGSEKFDVKIEKMKNTLKSMINFDFEFIYDFLEKYVPSVYKILIRIKIKNERRMHERVEYFEKVDKIKQQELEVMDGGPGALHSGRIKKSKKKKTGEIKVDESSSDSEIDLGPLSQSEIARRKLQKLTGDKNRQQPSEIYFDAVQHMSQVLGKRGGFIQDNILDEMTEIQNLCVNVNVVLEVLSQRVKDLDGQQQTFLEAG